MLYVLFNFTCKSASHSWGFHRFQIQIFTTSVALSQPGSLGGTRLSPGQFSHFYQRGPQVVKAAEPGSSCFPPHVLWGKYHNCSPNNTLPSIKNTLDSWNVASAILYFIFLRKPVYVSIYRKCTDCLLHHKLLKKAYGICQQFTQSFCYNAICIMCARLFSLVHHIEFCFASFFNLQLVFQEVQSETVDEFQRNRTRAP